MLDWIQNNRAVLIGLSAASVISWVGTLVLIPVIVIRIPADYFASKGRTVPATPWAGRHPILRIALRVARNIAGALLVIIGAILLVLPGQGALTILLGVLIMDIRAKYRVERWLISRPKVLHAVNWLRRRAARPPLRVADSPSPE